MKDLAALLRGADPVRADEGLAPADAQAIRRAMLAAVHTPHVDVPFWLRPLTLTAAIAVTMVVGILGGRLMIERESGGPVSAAAANVSPVAAGGGDRLQLQFSTPGGTRIIWIFDQNLRLQESMP